MKPNTSSNAGAVQHDLIAQRARKLWEERGRPRDRDLEHWLDAERQLRDELARRGPAGGVKGNSESFEAEKRLDGLVEPKPGPARRTPKGEQL